MRQAEESSGLDARFPPCALETGGYDATRCYSRECRLRQADTWRLFGQWRSGKPAQAEGWLGACAWALALLCEAGASTSPLSPALPPASTSTANIWCHGGDANNATPRRPICDRLGGSSIIDNIVRSRWQRLSSRVRPNIVGSDIQVGPKPPASRMPVLRSDCSAANMIHKIPATGEFGHVTALSRKKLSVEWSPTSDGGEMALRRVTARCGSMQGIARSSCLYNRGPTLAVPVRHSA